MMKKALGLLMLMVAISGCATFSDMDKDTNANQPQFEEESIWQELSEPDWRSNPSRRPMNYPPYYQHPKD